MAIIIEKPLCIIPARGGSKRLPGKNLALLGGKPLVAYPIEAALASGIFDTICLSSEDEKILDVGRSNKGVFALKRPAELAVDTARILHVCLFLLEEFSRQGRDFKTLCVLQPTCPFTTPHDIRGALDMFERTNALTLVTITDFDHPPFWALKQEGDFFEPFLGRDKMVRSQDLPTVFRPTGSIALAKTQHFLEVKNFYGDRMAGYYIPRRRAIDIDEEIDLKMAELLLQSGHD